MNTFVFVVAAIVLLVPVIARSQDYPSRPIRLIVPAAAGSGADVPSREVANELTKQLGQQVVVENRPGATAIIGYEALKRATPDGYAFGYVTPTIATNPSIYVKLPYDWERDFRPVIFGGRFFMVLTVSPALPVRSVKELIGYARANPGKLKYGSSGIGVTNHLSMALFNMMTNTAMMHVPYKGAQQAVMELIAGQIDIQCESLSAMAPYVRAARIRALAVTSLKRLDALPELPTLHESGLAGYEFSGWSGYAVPAGVSPQLIQRLNSEINKALTSPAITTTWASRNSIPIGGTPEQFADHVRKETARFDKLIKAAGIKPQ